MEASCCCNVMVHCCIHQHDKKLMLAKAVLLLMYEMESWWFGLAPGQVVFLLLAPSKSFVYELCCISSGTL